MDVCMLYIVDGREEGDIMITVVGKLLSELSRSLNLTYE